jgi:uncharacterized protein (DUF924 family)
MWKDKIEEILDFWFGHMTDETFLPDKKAKLWFQKDSVFDLEIQRRFEDVLHASARGELGNWADTPRGIMAYVVLLDQFPRNMYRDLPEEYAYDQFCLPVVREALKNGIDKKLKLVERMFLYMPLMHSEDPEDQETSIEYFTRLRDAVDQSNREYFEMVLDYAHRHKAIIDQFGRYPYRNDQLGRETTEEEEDFLKKPGSRF